MFDKNEILQDMSIEEKASLCSGGDYWHTKELKKYNIPRLTMSDGPHGLRLQLKQADNLGINESEKATCFPSGATICNSWDEDLIYKMGEALGEECLKNNVHILLGPGINIKRSPLCGRNFEYFSEDPYLTSKMGIAYVDGLQSTGVGACLKHFAANNQEERRRVINTIVDERTLREIYLYAFEYIVKETQPISVMSAYNKLNGRYCTENNELLGILKNEWEHKGIVITDWGAENNRVEGLIAGNELEMPATNGKSDLQIVQAVKEKVISEELLDERVGRLLDVVDTLTSNEKLGQSYDKQKHFQLATKIAEESIVLLKNEDGILPIKPKNIVVIGDMAKKPRYQGAGSSTINSEIIENAYDSFISAELKVNYASGYSRLPSTEDEKLRKEACKMAKGKDIVIIFAGLTEEYESEGIDRRTLDIPTNQNKLIEDILKVNKNVVVVLSGGAPVKMPWVHKVKAIVNGYLGGQASGKAIVNVLMGKVNPSGKLSETYPLELKDTPSYYNFPGSNLNVEYREGIYIGYRYYDTFEKEVLFPFGYGLSYTKFEYSDLRLDKIDMNKDEKIKLTVKVKNIGNVSGKEIVQIYVSKENSHTYRVKHELKNFQKVSLEAKEEKDIEIELDVKNFAYYNIEEHRWCVESGEYAISVAASSRDIKLTQKIQIKSNDPDLKEEKNRIVYKNVNKISHKDFETRYGNKLPLKELNFMSATADNTIEQLRFRPIVMPIYIYQKYVKMRKLLKEQSVNKATKVMMDLQKPLRCYVVKKGSKYTEEMLDGFIELVNFRFIRGIRKIIKSSRK